MSLLNYNILLDEEAFAKASDDLEALSNDLENLSSKIETFLSLLKTGYDTSAGIKFCNVCETNLLKPMNEQRLVLNHISKTLSSAKTQYQSVFDAYRDLNNSISSY